MTTTEMAARCVRTKAGCIFYFGCKLVAVYRQHEPSKSNFRLSVSVTAESGVLPLSVAGRYSTTCVRYTTYSNYVLRKSNGESDVCPSRETPCASRCWAMAFSASFPVNEMCGCQVLALRFSCYAPNQPRSLIECFEKKRVAKGKVTKVYSARAQIPVS
jgi:hypothetical protein